MYRDDLAVCPSCVDEVALDPTGQRLTCRVCGGVLVPAAEVAAMIAEMVAIYEAAVQPAASPDERPLGMEPPPAPSQPRAGARPCPRCGAAMDQQTLGEQMVDRCREHGFWFDGRELSLVLERMGGVVPIKPRPLWQRVLAALFDRRAPVLHGIRKPDDL